MAAEEVQRAVVEVPGEHAAARAVVVHHQVQREVLDEEGRPVAQRLLVERVQDGMAGAVGGGAGAVRLLLAVVQAHAAEGALVDPAVGRAREGHAVVLQLDDRARPLLAQVLDRVLVAEPVRPLDGVVHVPAPVVLLHVAERRRDAALGRHRVAAGGEELADARGLEPGLGEAEGRAQARAAGADDHHVVVVLGDGVGGHALIPPARSRSRNRARRARARGRAGRSGSAAPTCRCRARSPRSPPAGRA